MNVMQRLAKWWDSYSGNAARRGAFHAAEEVGRKRERNRIAEKVREKVAAVEGIDTDLYTSAVVLGLREALAIIEEDTE